MNIAVLHDKMGTLSGGCKCSLDTARALADEHKIYLYSYEKPDLSKWNVQFSFRWVKLPYLKFSGKLFVYRKMKEMLKFGTWFSDIDILISTFGQTVTKTHATRFFQWMYFPFIPSGWNLKYKLYRAPFDYLMKHTLHNTEKLLVFSEYVKRVAHKFYDLSKEQIAVIPLSIDCDSFNMTHEKHEDLVVTIASYCRWKHLEKVNEIAQQCPNFKFYVIGRVTNPSYFKHLRSIKAPNVEYFRDIPNYLVKEILAGARYYLHTNYNDYSLGMLDAEHFGICILEALASGCTILSHNSGGPVEILDKGKYGFLYNDHLEVPELLGDFVVNPEISRRRARTYDFSQFRKRLMEVLFN